MPGLQAHSSAMGQKDGEKWGAAADLQPTTPKSDRLLADRQGGPLFEKVGRRLVLTDTRKIALGCVQDIFLLGSELEYAVREKIREDRTIEFRDGVADVVPKSIAFHLVKPALKIDQPLRIECSEWRLERLLSELAVHSLNLVIADAPLPSTVSVKAFSHRLGNSRIAIFAARALKSRSRKPFPECLNGAPLLMPREDSAAGQRLRTWFKSQILRPRTVAEFDDSALAQEFGRRGVGYLLAPEVPRKAIESRLQVEHVGTIDNVEEQFYAISVEWPSSRLASKAPTGRPCARARPEQFTAGRSGDGQQAKMSDGPWRGHRRRIHA